MNVSGGSKARRNLAGLLRPNCARLLQSRQLAPRLTSSRLVGQGIWQHEDKFLVVNGGNAYLYDGSSSSRCRRPGSVPRSLTLMRRKHGSRASCRTTTQMAPEGAGTALQRLRQILGNWNWSPPVNPEVVAALVPATFVQACWTWRPLVSIIGASDAGKSTLLQQLIVPVLGEWAIAADRSTEAGLRQAIGCNAAPSSSTSSTSTNSGNRSWEFFRTSSRGGEILRGTADKTGLRYGVRHIAWFAAIESGDVWGQDEPIHQAGASTAEESRGLVLPGVSELIAIGRQLTAAALGRRRPIGLADAIEEHRNPWRTWPACRVVRGASGHVCRPDARPRRFARGSRRETLAGMINGRAVLIGQGERDEVRLLRDLLSSIVRVCEPTTGSRQRVRRASISQILCPQVRPDERPTLAVTNRAAGDHRSQGHPRWSRRRGGQHRLFIAHETVRRELLQRHRWASLQIDQVLSRLGGAERERPRLAGPVRSWGVSLPWPECLAELEGQDNQQDNENG